MRTLLYYGILFSFVCYWITTILFTMPDNYFTITFNKEQSVFQAFFYQRWSFFAPPPKFDDRLYYVVRNKHTHQQQTFEVINQILRQKQTHAPFNQEYNLLDYAINNSLAAWKEVLRKEGMTVKYKFPDSTENFQNKKILEVTWERHHKHPAIRTLMNYGTIVARRYQLDPQQYEFKILISQKDIPKFKDRNNKTIKTREILVFESPFYATPVNS